MKNLTRRCKSCLPSFNVDHTCREIEIVLSFPDLIVEIVKLEIRSYRAPFSYMNEPVDRKRIEWNVKLDTVMQIMFT